MNSINDNTSHNECEKRFEYYAFISYKREDEQWAKWLQQKLETYRDSAYMNSDRKERLESNGVFCGIIYRRVRGQKELTAEQKWHNRLVASFRAVAEHPFAWMKNTGYRRARYRGLSRNEITFCQNTSHTIEFT